MQLVFLSLDDVLIIHRDLIRRYGGPPEIRDVSLLESAIAQPSATFEGQYLHHDIYEMAAAYLFHIVMNHPFIDGNKRTGFAATLVFLFINGIPIDADEDACADVVLEVAQGRKKKIEIARFLRDAQANSR